MQVAEIRGWFPQQAPIGRIPLRGESPVGPNYTLCPPLCQEREGPLEETHGLEVYGSPKEEQSAVTQSAANRCRAGQPMAVVREDGSPAVCGLPVYQKVGHGISTHVRGPQGLTRSQD